MMELVRWGCGSASRPLPSTPIFQGSLLMSRNALVSLIIIAGLTLVTACIVVQDPPPKRPAPGAPGAGGPTNPNQPTDPTSPQPGTQPGNPGTGFDCSAPPARACCKALTEQCQSCAREAQAELAQWEQACTASTPLPQADCNNPRPAGACCEALTPECEQCTSNLNAQQAAWDTQCASTNPPPPVTVDCNTPPGRMCCQAVTPACNECQQKAREEVAEWERQCGTR